MRSLANSIFLVLIGLFLALVSPLAASAEEPERLLLATTTSVRDSGLLDRILPVFRERTGIHVQVVAVGTGAALRMGSDGNADVLLTHAPAAEKVVVESGAALGRRPFMENHFVLAGPPEDPAAIATASSPEDALRKIAAGEFPFVSRADDSGTHKREVDLLRQAGLDVAGGWKRFTRTGSGMGMSLQVAGERRAYILSDLGTFLAFRERVDLTALVAPSDSLRNVYSVLKINSVRFPRVNASGAEKFEAFLLDSETQEMIRTFGQERFKQALFRPLAAKRASP